jgi:hypothetical protein
MIRMHGKSKKEYEFISMSYRCEGGKFELSACSWVPEGLAGRAAEFLRRTRGRFFLAAPAEGMSARR